MANENKFAGLHRLKILFLATGVAACVYLIARTLLLGYTSYTPAEKLVGMLLLISESFLLLHAIGYARHAFMAGKIQQQTFPSYDTMTEFPQVAVVTAARHEPREVLMTTLRTLTALRYPNKKIYLLDDSSDPVFQREADELGAELGVTVFRRSRRHGAKAGIINDALTGMTEKYLAVFDADQNPMPSFLEKVLPILENDEKVAFVQTPQIYTNTLNNSVAEAAAMQQAIFYESICEGKSADNAIFCCGTNVVFKVDALRHVGSFDEDSVTEDFATSLKLHLAGYKSVYYNHTLAFGMAPESLLSYFKQQSRWATGTIGVFKHLLAAFAAGSGKMKPAQWWEYFLAGSYYFIGWVYFYLMLCPIMYLAFGLPSFFLAPSVYIATFAPYFLLSLMVFYSSVADRGYTINQTFKGLIANFLCFPVLMRASIAGLMNRRVEFAITNKGKKEELPFRMMLPHIIMMVLNVGALYLGLMRFRDFPVAVFVNSVWAAYHIILLSNIFRFNK